jgi:cupin fold WbuC family metalloprotein
MSSTDMKIITPETISELLARASGSPRKRTNLNFHAEPDDLTNRFLNAGIAGTYVCPHRHRPGKWELLTAIWGELDCLTFAADGVVKSRLTLSREGNSAVEIPGGEWHSVVFRAPSAVVLEVKPGPYEPLLDKEFASWAPQEDDPRAASFAAWLEGAAVGNKYRAVGCDSLTHP